MKRLWRSWCVFLLSGTALAAPASPSLRIYFIDVEGGQSTLVVAPTGEALLIDAGWEDTRDAGRIAATARAAGVTAIDALLVTHFHRDHAGGVANLAGRLPIRAVYDHGENSENYKGSAEVMAAYRTATAGMRHTVPRPGDKIPIRGIDITVITAGGKRIDTPLPHAGARNEVCGAENRKPDEQSENASSIGILVQFGNFRMLDLSDVLWNQELDLMCPVNRIGPAGLLVVSHHGKDTSNSGTLIRAVHPRVAIMDNSESKGGSPATFGILRNSPGFEDLWQLHYSIAAGNRNTPEKFIANPQGVCNGSGIQVVAAKDGSFRVINERSHLEKMYAATE